MKKIILLFCAALFCQAIFVSASENKKQKFSIQGKIDGLQKGDTLSFQKVVLPQFTRLPGFDIIINNDKGEFYFKGVQEHTQVYIMVYKPCDGKVFYATRTGREIMIMDKDRIMLRGTRQYVSFCKIDGGIYDNPIFREAQFLEDSLALVRTMILQKMDSALKAKDKEKSTQYSNEFNSFNPKGVGKRIMKLWEAYYTSPSTSEFTAKEIFVKASRTPIEELDETWGKLPPLVQKSYYGQILDETIRLKRNIEPGKSAPNFTLIHDNGDTVSLADFKGKYLLIYHWGMCPGSMQVDSRVRELYEKCDKQTLEIIGVSSSRNNVKELHAKLGPEDRILGMNALECLGGMLSHPFADFDLNTNDNNISNTYMFGGLPFFVFISPEQKIIARGFHEVFDQVYNQLIPKKEEASIP